MYGVPNAGGTGGTWADGRDGSAGARGFSAPRLWVVPPSAQPALRPGAALQGRPSTQPAVRAPLWPAQEAALTTPPGCTFLSRSSYTSTLDSVQGHNIRTSNRIRRVRASHWRVSFGISLFSLHVGDHAVLRTCVHASKHARMPQNHSICAIPSHKISQTVIYKYVTAANFRF